MPDLEAIRSHPSRASMSGAGGSKGKSSPPIQVRMPCVQHAMKQTCFTWKMSKLVQASLRLPVQAVQPEPMQQLLQHSRTRLRLLVKGMSRVRALTLVLPVSCSVKLAGHMCLALRSVKRTVDADPVARD